MERLSLVVKTNVKSLERGRTPFSTRVGLEQPRFSAKTMARHGQQLIEAMGDCRDPMIVISDRVLHQLSRCLNLVHTFELIQVSGVLEQNDQLSPDQASGIRFIASMIQMADSDYLRPVQGEVNPIVQMSFTREGLNFVLRPKRRMPEPESAVTSMMDGTMSISN